LWGEVLKEPVVLYSIQSFLAYYINMEYYTDFHYVWCAPCFDSSALPRTEPRLPPTSNPRELFNFFNNDVYIKDHHLSRMFIDGNIAGLTAGAEAKYRAGVITEDKKVEIIDLIRYIKEKRDFQYFRPIIYVIPYCLVQARVRRVNYKNTALPLSPEYLITDLHKDEFDVIDLDKEVLL